MTFRTAMIGLALLALAHPGSAQERRDPAGCSYAACALRLQSGKIVAGEDGRVVGEFGLFSLPDVRSLVQGSDSASYYAGDWERYARKARTLGFVATGLTAVGSTLVALGDPGSTQVGVGLGAMVAGLGFGFWGRSTSKSAFNALNTTIWWYNRELHEAETPEGAPGSGRR